MAGDEQDLAATLTRRLESLVVLIRDHSVRPLFGVVRIVILGLLAAVLGLFAAAATLIGLVRLFDHDVFPGRVWATYLLFGVVLLSVGAVLFRHARPKESPDARP